MTLLLALLAASAQPALFKTGDCGWVRGRYDVANGSRVHRIWMIGTSHLLSLDIPDEGYAPPPLKRYYDSRAFRPFRTRMFADFYVCARRERVRGHMQEVHLERVRNVRIVRY